MSAGDPVALAEAVALLPEGALIHTFRGGGYALLGADWPRDAILEALRAARVIRTAGELAQRLKHGLAIPEGGSWLFIETTRLPGAPPPT